MKKLLSKSLKYFVIPVLSQASTLAKARPICRPAVVTGLSLGLIVFLLVSSFARRKPESPFVQVPGTAPFISDVYVIHSHRSAGVQDSAPAVCRWLVRHGGQLLQHASCTPFAGFWASASTRDQILDLIARRIVAPETHAKPQGPLTRLLYRLGLSANAPPLFNEREEVIDVQSLSSAASHALAWQDWIMGMIKLGMPPAERAKRLLLVLEDDVNLTSEAVSALQHALPRLDPSFDILALDSADGFCSLSCMVHKALAAMGLAAPADLPRLVRVRTSFSRTTGVVLSHKGALQLFRYLPITRVSDLWERDLVTDRILNVYVACPRIVSASTAVAATAVTAAVQELDAEADGAAAA